MLIALMVLLAVSLLPWLWLVSISRRVVVVISVTILLLRCGDVLRKAIEGQSRDKVRPWPLELWACAQRLVRSIAGKAVFVHGLLVQLSLTLCLLLFSQQELIKAKSVDWLDLLLKDLRYRIAFSLEEMNQVHNLLLSQSKIGDLILKCLQQTLELNVLSYEHIDILNKLFVLLLNLLVLRRVNRRQIRSRSRL